MRSIQPNVALSLLWKKQLRYLVCPGAQCFSMRHSSTTTEPSGANLKSEMHSKGFKHGTPNFNTDFSTDTDASYLADDLVTTPAVDVDYLRDIYGPWLVMTDDLQGELFCDHDQFVYYRPANGLGYGIGKLEVLNAGATGTAFTCSMEAYMYQQTDMIVPQYGIQFDITGMVKKVTTKSSTYETFSLVGVWRRENKNNDSDVLVPEQQKDKQERVSLEKKSEKSSGQFNAAKLSPWDASAAEKPFEPNLELVSAFRHMFPQPLNATSHIRRSMEAAKEEQASTRELSIPIPHLNLDKYAVGSIPGLYYIPNYISAEEEERILQYIRDTPAELKSKLTKRTVQEWGCSMCSKCEKSFVADANMPTWVQECVDMQTYDGLFTPTTFANSVRIHEYEPGEGIGPHCDGPIYVPMVTVLSLASPCLMSFYPRQDLYDGHPMDHYNDTFKFKDGEIGKRTPLQSILMEPRSLLIFSGQGYYYYPHGVSDKEEEVLDESVVGPVVNRSLLENSDIASIKRTYRASITTRNLMTRCNDQPARAEFAMKRAWYLYHHQPLPAPLFTPPPVLHSVLPAAAESAVPSMAVRSRNCAHQAQSESIADYSDLSAKVNRLVQQQDEVKRSVEELKQMITVSIGAQHNFQESTSTILNHVSASVLQLDARLDDIAEELENKK